MTDAADEAGAARGHAAGVEPVASDDTPGGRAPTPGAGPIAEPAPGAWTPLRAALVSLGVVAAAALVLLAYAGLYDPSRLHVHGNFVDQAGYVTTARVWVDQGRLESGLDYPAYLGREGWRLYMPGHYAALALSYLVLGYGVFASLLPSLAGYALTALAVFWCGERLAGWRTGAAAALAWGLFPGSLTYAFTAMAESTFVAAGALALLGFLLVPRARRPWVAPLLVGFPFLFRETGALLALPFSILLAHAALGRGATRGRRLAEAGLAVGGAAVLCWGLLAWQLADGKVAITPAFVTGESFNYADLHPAPRPEPTLGDWTRGLAANARRNLEQTGKDWTELRDARPVAEAWTLLAATVLCLAAGAWRLRRDPVPLAAGLTALAFLALVYVLYDAKGQKLLRTMLFATPLLALGSVAAGRAFLGRLPRAAARAVAFLLLGLAIWGSRSAAADAGAELVRRDATIDFATARLERVHPDADGVLASHFLISLDWAVKHYPTRWSFLPANDATLDDMMEHHGGLATLVVPSDFLNRTVTEAGLARHGFERQPAAIRFPDRVYLVYRRGS